MIPLTIPPTFCLNPTPIQSAGERLVVDQIGSMPNQASVIKGWFRPLIIGHTANKFVNGEAQPTITTVNVSGHLQPSEPEKLEIQLYGDRSWKYFYLYVDCSLVMENDDNCAIAGTPYVVIGKKDWSANGFIRYRLHEDFSDAHASN